MVGLLYQALTNKKMVCFFYRGAKRYVTPVRVQSFPRGAVLLGQEYAAASLRQYNVGEMIGLSILEESVPPEAYRLTPWPYGDEGEEKLTEEEKLLRAASKM